MSEVRMYRDAVTFSPVGSCIYCGATEGLTKEHIVPLGLGGQFVLPTASCPTCSKITSDFERRVLRGFMFDGRIVGNFPTRRRRERPTTLSVEVQRAEGPERVELPVHEACALLHLPVLAPGAFLSGKPPVQGGLLCGFQTLQFGQSLEQVMLAVGAKTILNTSQVDATAFMRMLAKIGYGFAVALNGRCPLNEVPVLPLILGEADDGATWVGSSDFRLTAEAECPRHGAEIVGMTGTIGGTSERVTVARVKLFANTGARGYEIVVRRARIA